MVNNPLDSRVHLGLLIGLGSIAVDKYGIPACVHSAVYHMNSGIQRVVDHIVSHVHTVPEVAHLNTAHDHFRTRGGVVALARGGVDAVEIFIVGMAVSPVESAVGGKGHRLEIVVDSHGVTLADGRDLGGVLIHGEELAVIAHAVELAVGCARKSDGRFLYPVPVAVLRRGRESAHGVERTGGEVDGEKARLTDFAVGGLLDFGQSKHGVGGGVESHVDYAGLAAAAHRRALPESVGRVIDFEIVGLEAVAHQIILIERECVVFTVDEFAGADLFGVGIDGFVEGDGRGVVDLKIYESEFLVFVAHLVSVGRRDVGSKR